MLGADEFELVHADSSSLPLVEELEGLEKVFFGVLVLAQLRSDFEELSQVDGSVSPFVLLDGFLNLLLQGVLSEGSEDGSHFFGLNDSVSVSVEEDEELFEPLEFLWGQFKRHYKEFNFSQFSLTFFIMFQRGFLILLILNSQFKEVTSRVLQNTPASNNPTPDYDSNLS